MPSYNVTIDGHNYLVEVPDPTERPVRAIIDGEVLEVIVSSELPNASGSRASAQRPSDPVGTTRSEVQPPYAPASSLEGRPSTGVGPSTGDGAEITAPLPGTIVGISVAMGDTFTRGQELCVLEAMKMNNPIRAARAGTVREIRVIIGQQVQHGTVLMVVEEA